MKVNIASILKNEGASMNISGSVNPGEFDFMGSKITFTSPALVTGTIVNIGGTIEISADIKGEFLRINKMSMANSPQYSDHILVAILFLWYTLCLFSLRITLKI